MRNSSLGASFALGGKFGNPRTWVQRYPKFSSKYKTSTANTRICDLDSATHTQNAESSADSAESQNLGANQTKIAESANKSQPTIEGIAVEVVGFLDDFGRKARLKSAQCPKSSKSTQDAPKRELQKEIAYDSKH